MSEYRVINKRNKKLCFAALSFAVLILFTVIYFNKPQGDSVCPSKTVFGLYCSGCGITRAVYSLLRFDFAAAFNYNQFFVLSLPLYACLYIAAVLKIFFNRNILPRGKALIAFAVIYLLLFLLYGIMRNFNVFAFLAPH